jgi:hypothetical protein
MGNATLDTALAYCGAQDNGTTKWDGNPDWNEVFGGDGGYCVVDYENDNTVYAEWQNGHRARSDNGGASFADINPGIDGDGAWVTPMVLDPFDHNTIYTTTSNNTPRVWKSPTRGSNSNWQVVGSPVGGNNQCLEASALEPGRLYLASESNVLRYDFGGDWTNVTGNLPGQWVTHVVPDRFNPDVVYVSLSGFSGAHVFKSMQAGGSWVDITGNLPDVPTNDVVVDLTDPSTLYVGTDIGVFRTVDGGVNWAVFGEVMPAVRVDDMEMQVATGKLRAATHGRGLWEIPTNSAALTLFYPNGGEVFQPGQNISVRWGGTAFGGNVRLEINRTYPSATWSTLFASTPNDGLEDWTVTEPASDHVRFRLTLLGQQEADTSNGDSRIVNPALHLLWPNGGETVLSGVRDTIRFERTLVPEDLRIELNRDYPGGAWDELASGISNDLYLWPVQLPASTNARIRITSQDRPELSDESDASFILRAPVMLLVTPVGGEQIPIAQPYQIRWEAAEHLGTIRIVLNRNYPEGTWDVITQNTQNDGVYSWSPTGPPSEHCRVRVATLFDPNQTYVESASDFTLYAVSADEPPQLPATFALSQPYPNPFNPVTQIELALPAGTKVVAAVFNRLGQQVALLADREFEPGKYSLTFDGTELSSGIYFIRITAYDETHMVKAMLLR